MADLRRPLQQALVYFGLAEEPGAPRQPEGGRDVFATVVAPPFLGLVTLVDRGAGLAVVVLVLFVPALLRFAVALRRGSRATRPDRVGDALFIPPVMFAGALLFFPERLGVWWPAATALAVSVALIGVGLRRRDVPAPSSP